jgi:hypothetical protein
MKTFFSFVAIWLILGNRADLGFHGEHRQGQG